MKKLGLLLVGIFACMVTHAGYLYWQVNANYAEGIDTSGATWTLNGNTITGFRLSAIDADGYVTALTSYVVAGDDPVAKSNPISLATAQTADLYADVSSVYSSGYSYFIEVIGYDSSVYGSNTGVIGQSTKSVTYEQLSTAGNVNYVADLGSISDQISPFVGQAYAAPEPTSGILLLVGFALMGLKRKRA